MQWGHRRQGHKMSDLKAKMHRNRFRLGLCPRSRSRSLQPPAGFFTTLFWRLNIKKTFTNHKFRVSLHVTFCLNDRCVAIQYPSWPAKSFGEAIKPLIATYVAYVYLICAGPATENARELYACPTRTGLTFIFVCCVCVRWCGQAVGER